jgi:uncharacterized protein YcsI (UPF0317 family)
MRALRTVVDVRAVTAGAVIAVAVLGSAGCAKFDAALGKQELVVAFRPGTSQDAMMKARSACSNVPSATPEPVPTGASATSGVYDVRFRIDHASEADVARLEQCLSRFPSIQGVNVEQAGGS